MRDVIFDKGLDEVIAVIVALVPTQSKRLSCLQACGFKHLRMELLDAEFICKALIDENAFFEACCTGAPDEIACVILPPSVAIVAQVAGKRLLAPWTAHRCRNRCECR